MPYFTLRRVPACLTSARSHGGTPENPRPRQPHSAPPSPRLIPIRRPPTSVSQPPSTGRARVSSPRHPRDIRTPHRRAGIRRTLPIPQLRVPLPTREGKHPAHSPTSERMKLSTAPSTKKPAARRSRWIPPAHSEANPRAGRGSVPPHARHDQSWPQNSSSPLLPGSSEKPQSSSLPLPVGTDRGEAESALGSARPRFSLAIGIMSPATLTHQHL